MKIQCFQVDAFAEKLFTGNPAAVCPLESWPADGLMQQIAMENNLSETAFFVPANKGYHIRWFTPSTEVDLCGHATLASAHVIFNHLNYKKNTIYFDSLSGPLHVQKNGELLELNFPVDTITPISLPGHIKDGMNMLPLEAYQGKTDYLLIYDSEEQIANIEPDYRSLAEGKARGVIATARGNDVDFVSRFFAPGAGIDEDPVTGSAHTTLTPYWAEQLGKNSLEARQISKRGGNLRCILDGERVRIAGKAVTFFEGTIHL
ncbi:MAG: PhzF family phenazine biosynthesis protein [Bacteroidota bacterium]